MIDGATLENVTSSVDALAADYAAETTRTIAGWQSLTTRTSASEKIAIWGAGAKGVTLANLVDATCQHIDCVVDINPAKQGHFLPGTGHPIVAPDQLAPRGVTRIIITNPNYHAEIAALLTEAGIDAHVLELPK